MSFNDILPIILIILFWAILFVFAFWMATVALRAPTEGEVEAQHAEAERTQTPAVH